MLKETRDPAIYDELERRHRENLGPAAVSLEQLKKGLDTHLALVDLMRAMRKYGRPSKYPDDLRAAWDECERVLGDDLAGDIERQIHRTDDLESTGKQA